MTMEPLTPLLSVPHPRNPLSMNTRRRLPAALFGVAILSFLLPFGHIFLFGVGDSFLGISLFAIGAELDVPILIILPGVSILAAALAIGFSVAPWENARTVGVITAGVALAALIGLQVTASYATREMGGFGAMQLFGGYWLAVLAMIAGSIALFFRAPESPDVAPETVGVTARPVGSTSQSTWQAAAGPIARRTGLDSWNLMRSSLSDPAGASLAVATLTSERLRYASIASLAAFVIAGIAASAMAFGTPVGIGMRGFAVLAVAGVSTLWVVTQLFAGGGTIDASVGVTGLALSPMVPALLIGGILGMGATALFIAALLAGIALAAVALHGALLNTLRFPASDAAKATAIVTAAAAFLAAVVMT